MVVTMADVIFIGCIVQKPRSYLYEVISVEVQHGAIG